MLSVGVLEEDRCKSSPDAFVCQHSFYGYIIWELSLHNLKRIYERKDLFDVLDQPHYQIGCQILREYLVLDSLDGEGLALCPINHKSTVGIRTSRDHINLFFKLLS